MKIKFLLEVDLKGSNQPIQEAANIIAKMINKEFQDPKNGVMLLIKDIKEALVVITPEAIQVPPPRPTIKEGHLEITSLRFRKRMRIDQRRMGMGLPRVYDPQTGRRLNNG